MTVKMTTSAALLKSMRQGVSIARAFPVLPLMIEDIGLTVVGISQKVVGERYRWRFALHQDCCDSDCTLSQSGFKTRLRRRVKGCTGCQRRRYAAEREAAGIEPKKRTVPGRGRMAVEETRICREWDKAHAAMSKGLGLVDDRQSKRWDAGTTP